MSPVVGRSGRRAPASRQMSCVPVICRRKSPRGQHLIQPIFGVWFGSRLEPIIDVSVCLSVRSSDAFQSVSGSWCSRNSQHLSGTRKSRHHSKPFTRHAWWCCKKLGMRCGGVALAFAVAAAAVAPTRSTGRRLSPTVSTTVFAGNDIHSRPPLAVLRATTPDDRGASLPSELNVFAEDPQWASQVPPRNL